MKRLKQKVIYAEKKELIDGIIKKYRPDWLMEDDVPPNAMPVGGAKLAQSEKSITKKESVSRVKGRKTGGLKTSPRNIPIEQHRAAIEELAEPMEVEVENSGQT